jgi:hypothetical protein
MSCGKAERRRHLSGTNGFGIARSASNGSTVSRPQPARNHRRPPVTGDKIDSALRRTTMNFQARGRIR